MSQVFKITDIKTDLDWTVRVVFKGDRYGLNWCLTHDEDEPMIEFYDAEYDFEVDLDGRVLGQFVSRYNADTLLEGFCSDWGHSYKFTNGLNLDGGIPKWSINRMCMNVILSKCSEIIEGNEAAA